MTDLFAQNSVARPMRGWQEAIFVLILGCAVFFCNFCEGARNRPSYEEDKSSMLREILDSLHDLRHEVSNHEAEIRMFEEKFKTQEDLIDALQGQLNEALHRITDTLKVHSSTIDTKIAKQENSAKNLTTELKTYSNDFASSFTDYKTRLSELEKAIEIQNRNLDNMQTALRSLTEAWQVKEEVSEANPSISTKVYRVKAGDSLEKIAKLNNTTIKKLKEINNLSGDQIIIGQKLQIPE